MYQKANGVQVINDPTFRKIADDDAYCLSWSNGNKYADIEFYADGDIMITRVEFGSDPCTKEIRCLDFLQDNVFEEIEKLIKYVQN